MERMKNFKDEVDRLVGEYIEGLEEENKKLKEVNKKLGEWVDKLTKDTFGVAEENKKLNIKVASLEGEIKGLNSVIEKLREELSAYDREYFDEDKKAEHIFMEEDTLQELKDLGKI